ncbi:hypothetical protein DYB37_001834 [Aphanomyces astaci]|uniref:Uncharacterized protein n=1 Tax=Aphanomyces astaci TaxID=112090 RepID=A0A397F1Q0_APHAT|nr:hypothetical protein DYB31_008618 [Aphanomyces astaci]RHZ26930.1 hypothetical protein DYB37_001834 [Aphanomyces astaci]
MMLQPAGRLLKPLGLRFRSSYAAKKGLAPKNELAPKKKPTAPWLGLAVGSALGTYGGYEVWKTWSDEKNPAHVYDRLPGGKTAEEAKMASEAQVCPPVWMREPIYNAWTRAFDCKLDEMKYPLEHYKNLGEFFSRPLKDGIRPVNWDPRCVSSPVDGTMASFGVVDFTDDIPVMEQIKALLGRWKHGFFSMSLVGATNVGSMTLDVEPDFATNKWVDFYLTKPWGSCDTKKYERQELVTRGDQVAQFKVRYGASIGHFQQSTDGDVAASTFPSTSDMIRLASQANDQQTKASYLSEISQSIGQMFFGRAK